MGGTTVLHLAQNLAVTSAFVKLLIKTAGEWFDSTPLGCAFPDRYLYEFRHNTEGMIGMLPGSQLTMNSGTHR